MGLKGIRLSRASFWSVMTPDKVRDAAVFVSLSAFDDREPGPDRRLAGLWS
jgi:hypothetical protein